MTEMKRHSPGGRASDGQWSNGHPTFCADNLDNSLPWRQEHKSQQKRSFFHELINWQIFVGGVHLNSPLLHKSAPPGCAVAPPQAPLPWYLGQCGGFLKSCGPSSSAAVRVVAVGSHCLVTLLLIYCVTRRMCLILHDDPSGTIVHGVLFIFLWHRCHPGDTVLL